MSFGEFLEPESMYSIMAWRFSIKYFFSVILNKSPFSKAKFSIPIDLNNTVV